VTGEFSHHGRTQLAIERQPSLLRPAPPQEGLIVGIPGLIAAVRFPVPRDLAVDGLVTLADCRGDLLDGITTIAATRSADYSINAAPAPATTNAKKPPGART
jgi:hypothetical protein